MGIAADILVFLNQSMAYSLKIFFEILCVRVFACTNVCALYVCKYAYSESEEGIGSLGTGATGSCQLWMVGIKRGLLGETSVCSSQLNYLSSPMAHSFSEFRF